MKATTQMTYKLEEVIVRNRLDTVINNVRVVFTESNKGRSLLSYIFNWTTVDIESGDYVRFKKEVVVGEVKEKQQVKTKCELPFYGEERCYWQVYFHYGGRKYKINKNNAMVNPLPQDNRQYVEITVRREGSNIRLDFVMNSGDAYFYAEQYI